MPRLPGGEIWRTRPASERIPVPSCHQADTVQSGTRPGGTVIARSDGWLSSAGAPRHRPVSGQSVRLVPFQAGPGSMAAQSVHGSSRTRRGPFPPAPTPHVPARPVRSRTICAVIAGSGAPAAVPYEALESRQKPSTVT